MFKFEYKDIDFAHKYDEHTQPSDEYTKHIHSFCEIYFFVSGNVTYTVEKQTHKLYPKDLIVIWPGSHHFCDVDPDVPYERYVLKVPVSYIPRHIIEDLKNADAFIAGTDELVSLFALFDNVFERYADPDDVFTMQTSILKMVLITIRLIMRNSSRQNNIILPPLIIQEMIDYINTNLNSPLTLTDLSEHFNYSKSYLSVQFKKYMKIPLMQYIRTKKIYKAKSLIDQGYKSTTVAESLGFEEYSTFYRAYVKIIGVPPSPSPNRV